MKIRLDRDRFDRHCKELQFPNKLIIKKPDTRGGLTLIWKSDMVLDVINYTENHVLAKVVEEDGFEWFLTCFYGWRLKNISPGHCCDIFLLLLLGHGVVLEISMHFFMLLKNKANIHLHRNRWKSFKWPWIFAIWWIWDLMDILSCGTTSDLV